MAPYKRYFGVFTSPYHLIRKTPSPSIEGFFLWSFEMIKRLYKRFLLWALEPALLLNGGDDG